MTNIIYLTTRCNLDCNYCYEREARLAPGFIHKVATSEEIASFVTAVQKKGEDSPCVVLFGGEPLLRPDLLDEVVEAFLSKQQKVCFDLVTNGTLITAALARKLKAHKEALEKVGSGFSVEVSYDVSGQSRRVYPDGSSSQEKVLEGISELRKGGVPFAISYVVSNTNFHNLVKDVLYCILGLGAAKVCLRWAESEFTNVGLSVLELKQKVRPLLMEVYRRYQISICDEVCGACQRCNKRATENTYMIPGKGVQPKPRYEKKGAFNHFS